VGRGLAVAAHTIPPPEGGPMGETPEKKSLVLSASATRVRRVAGFLGRGFLLAVTSSSILAVLFIFFYITRDSLPFFWAEDFTFSDFIARLDEFFTGTKWYPSGPGGQEPSFGALPVFIGSGLVTLGAVLVAVPLGVAAAICLSDVLPFSVRQLVKPVIEILAAIPSVTFGFFALVVFAPLLQNHGGLILESAVWVIGLPIALLVVLVLADVATSNLAEKARNPVRIGVGLGLLALAALGLWALGDRLGGIEVSSGTNALNVSIILGIMALPTVVSVSEDALQAVGREMREGSYALGATRAETMMRVVLPAASSGILAAVILGVMRAFGETMVVLMASGNTAKIPQPWYNFLEPVRTLTATIAGDMGEADHSTGSERYHVLFAMALCLLVFSFSCNLVSEWAVRRTRRKLAGE
jgi:phosphate transport system permease protein